MPPTTLTAKKKCCKSSPRCKRCPVVLKRLGDAGFLERTSKRGWRVVAAKIPKAAWKAARRK